MHQMHFASLRMYINSGIRKNMDYHEYEFDASNVQTISSCPLLGNKPLNKCICDCFKYFIISLLNQSTLTLLC